MQNQATDNLKKTLQALSPAERKQLLEAARRNHAADDCIQHRFEAWAEKTPGAIAVRCGTEQLTYAQLDRRATLIANRLLASGLSKGDLVALTLDRGVGLVAAIIGILKAGGAYLPIDPTLPESRRSYIGNDARPAAVVTESRYADQFAQWTAPVLCIDTIEQTATTAASSGLPAVAGQDLAYVIYTSGSTGEPKGVMIEHRNVVSLFDAADSRFDFSERDVWTLFHSYAFDFSVWEMWGALSYGGCLIVVPYLVSRSAPAFAKLLIEEGVTVLNQTPSAFTNLMPTLLDGDTPGALRYVVFGGEALETRRLLPWLDRFGEDRTALVNMYGITETTVHVTYKRLTRADAVTGISDIGVALSHLRLLLLNKRGRKVPEGVVGEIHVAGAGLSRGYLNRPELTEQRFVENPLGPGRLYRTGDLARALPDGRLEYVGRNDGQVKLRGFRIELGDIEKHLLTHPGINAAVVALAGDGDERQLVAYVMRDDDDDLEWRGALLAHLKRELPDYMVPARAVVLDALPLTGNGKVDLTALPAPGDGDVWFEDYQAPGNEIEATLCRIYADLLGVERVGAGDNFFSLGGDSLKTVNLVARAKAAGLQFQIADIFANPRVADLARIAQDVGEGPDTQETLPFALIEDADRERLPEGAVNAYPMSHLQQGMVFHNLESADNSHYHNVISQRYRGRLDFERVRQALADIMQSHDILRTSFHLTGYSEPLQVVHETVDPPMTVKDVSDWPEREREQFLEDELARLRAEPFALDRAPLFAAHLYIVGSDEFELIWSEHHAILDGWSLASFMTQLARQYVALGEGRRVTPRVRPSYYQDFIGAERASLANSATAGFWSDYLDGAVFTRLQGDAADGSAHEIGAVDLPQDLYSACRELASRLGVPIKAVLLAAYARTVSRFSNESTIQVGITTHGRPDDHDSVDCIGLYVSTHPLVVECTGQRWSDLIGACWAAEAEIWSHRHFPISRIKQLRGGSELFETTFTYNNFSITHEADDLGVTALRERRAYEDDEIGLGVAFIVTDEAANACQLHVSYNPNRFSGRFAQRFQRALTGVLGAMVENDEMTGDSLEEDSESLIARLAGRTAVAAPTDTLIGEFSTIVSRHGDAVAAESDSGCLTFAELDQRATALAGQLDVQGVGPGTLVGIDAQPSPEMLAAIVAILERGAAFIPLDPDLPDSRIDAIVKESGLTHVVASQSLRAPTVYSGVTVCRLDFRPDAPGQPACRSIPEIDADTLAYVMYTSGSTGKPKGVAITHGSSVSLLRSLKSCYGFDTGERLLQFSNVGFDIFVEDLITTIFGGNTLVIAARDELLDPRQFWRVMHEQRISYVNLPTAYWALLCRDPGQAVAGHDLEAFRICAVGGEAMPPDRLHEWQAYFGARVALWNVYGPAEATSLATAFDTRLLTDSRAAFRTVPIGVPLAHAGCWVLGKDLEPVPAGVVGELYIGGSGLAQGYFGDESQTRGRFVTLAPRGESQRLFRTGDLVRCNCFGELEFVGRADKQLKIRGFRVEPEEVEQLIAKEPDIAQCAVTAYARQTDTGDSSPDRRLAAYVVLAPGAGAGRLDAAIERIRRQLPDYMVPGAWVELESLPLTVNGKIDLKRLPEPKVQSDATPVEAATDTERQLSALWRDLLGHAPASVETDFFAAGGHSLLLTRLLLSIGETFGVQLSIGELMNKRSIRDMAQLVDGIRQFEELEPAPNDEQFQLQEW